MCSTEAHAAAVQQALQQHIASQEAAPMFHRRSSLLKLQQQQQQQHTSTSSTPSSSSLENTSITSPPPSYQLSASPTAVITTPPSYQHQQPAGHHPQQQSPQDQPPPSYHLVHEFSSGMGKLSTTLFIVCSLHHLVICPLDVTARGSTAGQLVVPLLHLSDTHSNSKYNSSSSNIRDLNHPFKVLKQSSMDYQVYNMALLVNC